MQTRSLNKLPKMDISAGKSIFVILVLVLSGIVMITTSPFTETAEAQATSEPGWSTIFDYDVGDFPEHFATGDVDDNGFADVVVANLFDDTVSVMYNDQRGKLINRTDFITGTSGNGPRAVIVADVREDNNEDLDIIVANYYGGTLTVLYNDGTGNFTKPINFSCLTDPTWLEATDLNGDDYIDIICNDFFKNKIGIMINDQNGGFSLTNSYDVGTHPREFTIADIDGDGDMDIISADLLDDTITIYENLGSGSFTKRDTYKTDSGPRSICAGDIDGDNDIDLITANRHTDTISILYNNNINHGNYSSRIEYDSGETPIKVNIGDVDMDGDLDIACVNLHDNNVQIFNNSGTGIFPSSFLIYTHPGPYHVEILDMDNDADNDIVISSAYKDKLLTVFRDRRPRIEFTEPDGIDDLADLEYTIKWFGNDPDKHNILSVDLFYNVRVDDGKAGETRGAGDDDGWVELPSPRSRPDPSTGEGVVYGVPIVFGTENDFEYVWDCSEVPNGSYQLAAIISDDYGNYFSATSDYNVTITHNVPPKLIILNPPDGEEIYAHTSFTIRWADSDPDDNAIINISYDNDNNSANGNSGRLVTERSEDKDGDNDKYKWKTSSVPEGEYYIVFETTDGHRDTMINYSTGKVIIDHDPTRNAKPDISIIDPDGVDDTVDASYFITWTDYDMDDDAEITLYYDEDDQGFNGIEIVSGIMEDDDEKTLDGSEINMYVWNTTLLTDGDYYIYAKIEDGVWQPKYNYSSGPLTIFHRINNEAPTIRILEPDGVQDDGIDKAFVIKWDDTDPDDNAIIKLYYSPLKEYFSGQFVEGAWNIPENDEEDYYVWVTTEIPDGDYYIYALITDNVNDIGKSMSKGPITIEHIIKGPNNETNIEPFIEIVEPDGINDVVNESFIIKWVDYDPNDDAFIAVYYDINSSGLKGELIQDLLSEDGEMDELVWNTLFLDEGDYYIYAIISDGEFVFADYSLGPVTIDHKLPPPVGPITTPKARITSPKPNSHYKPDEQVIFDASGTEGDGLAFTWYSDRYIDPIGNSDHFQTTLSPGTHIITLYILDERGQSDQTTIIVTVTEEGETEELIEGVEDWVIYTFLGIIILLIIIIVAIGFLGKKKPDKDEEKTKDKDAKSKKEGKDKDSKHKTEAKSKPTDKPKPAPKTEVKPKPKK